jgi:hypothetical protein
VAAGGLVGVAIAGAGVAAVVTGLAGAAAASFAWRARQSLKNLGQAVPAGTWPLAFAACHSSPHVFWIDSSA